MTFFSMAFETHEQEFHKGKIIVIPKPKLA